MFAVRNRASNIIHRLKVSVEGDLDMAYVFKEGHDGYEKIIDNFELNEMRFTEGENGGIVYSITHYDSSAKRKGILN